MLVAKSAYQRRSDALTNDIGNAHPISQATTGNAIYMHAPQTPHFSARVRNKNKRAHITNFTNRCIPLFSGFFNLPLCQLAAELLWTTRRMSAVLQNKNEVGRKVFVKKFQFLKEILCGLAQTKRNEMKTRKNIENIIQQH